MRLGLRRWARRLHLILALTVGIILALSGLTGSALVYRAELEALIDPLPATKTGEISPEAPGRIIDQAIEQTAARYGQNALHFIYLPRQLGQPLEIWVVSNGSQRILRFDPGNGEIMRDAKRDAGLFGTLARLHIELLAGDAGHTALGVSSVASLILLGTGIWLAWPGARKLRLLFRLRLRGHVIVRWADMHRTAGLAVLPVLLLAIATGTTLVFGGLAANLLIGASGTAAVSAPSLEAAKLSRPVLAPSALIRHATAALTGATPTRLALPVTIGRPAVVRLRHSSSSHINGMSFIAVHPQSGRILSVRDETKATRGQYLLDIRYPLHTGAFFGPAGRGIAFATGLFPAVLLATGILYWRHRRGARPSRTSKRRHH